MPQTLAHLCVSSVWRLKHYFVLFSDGLEFHPMNDRSTVTLRKVHTSYEIVQTVLLPDDVTRMMFLKTLTERSRAYVDFFPLTNCESVLFPMFWEGASPLSMQTVGICAFYYCTVLGFVHSFFWILAFFLVIIFWFDRQLIPTIYSSNLFSKKRRERF